ncbi:DUF2191 domain-containing protein [Streptomyces globisporus]|uniref:DUF2191 domain-containing protein n=1 Tax=Streptomyces globisporus TaxID=1908 RepID=UPI0036794C2E
MAKVTVSLDAELVVEAMVLAGVGNPQDAIELVVGGGGGGGPPPPAPRPGGGPPPPPRGHRTEALVAEREGAAREVEIKPEAQQG